MRSLHELTPDALAQRFADLFETDVRGREILDYLTRRFGQAGAAKTGGIDAVLSTYYRCGQRELLDFVHAQIGRAHGETSSSTPEALTD